MINGHTERLPNCAEILERNYDSRRGYWIILAYNGGEQPYVVWSADDNGYTYSGHYFYSKDGALAKWRELTKIAASPLCVST